MIPACASLRRKISAVLVAIANEGHRIILQRCHQKRPRAVALPTIFLKHYVVGIDVHLAQRAFRGNVLYLTRTVGVENLAAKNALDDLALGLVKFLCRCKRTLDAADLLSMALEEERKHRDRRGVSQNNARVNSREYLYPLLHIFLARKKWIELVHAADKLAHLELRL